MVTKYQGNTVVTRGAFSTGTCNTVSCTGSGGYTMAAYYCAKDLCNSGNREQIKLSSLVLVALSSMLLRFLTA